MRHANNHRSMLDKLRGLFKKRGTDSASGTASSQSEVPPDTGDDLRSFSFFSNSQGIQVEEVEQTEFVLEWQHTVVEEATAHEQEAGEAPPFIDLRLPNFDRRMADRRSGDRRNGNGYTEGHTVRVSPSSPKSAPDHSKH